MDIVCNDDSNAIPKKIEALGGRVFIVPSFKKLKGHTDALQFDSKTEAEK